MKKKALSLALALAMCLGLTVSAYAAEPKKMTFPMPGWDTGDVIVTLDGVVRDEDMEVQELLVYNDGRTQYWPYTYHVYYVTSDSTISIAFSTVSAGWEYTLNSYKESGGSMRSDQYWNKVIPDSSFEDIKDQKPLNLTLTKEDFERAVPGGEVYSVVLSVGGEVEDYYLHVSFVDQTSSQPTTPAAQSAAASPTNDSLTSDGVLQNPTVYKIDGSNYFKIRDLAAILNGSSKQFSVGYDSSLNSVTATTGQGYAKQSGDLAGAPAGGTKTAQPSNDAIYINGQKVDAQVYKIDGSNYFKLRDLGKALDFYVGWSAEQGVYIETDKPYAE